jgi:outer membrane protein assembly factor BamD
MKTRLRPFAVAIITLTAVLGAGCKSDAEKKKKELAEDAIVVGKSDEELEREAGLFYAKAHKSLSDGDYQIAVEAYDRLARRYPFTDYAQQAQIERIYALYRSSDPDKAMSAAEKFIREHPRHPHVDYAQYMKGLINFERQPSFMDFLAFDDARRDVGYERSSFDDFALLVQKYPTSQYVGDARNRMIYLRDRIARHDLAIVDFYMRRGAYVAAAKRAEQIIAQYPGSPASYEVLGMLEECYRRMNLSDQADEVARLRAAQGVAADLTGDNAGSDNGFFSFNWWPFGHHEQEAAAEAAPPATP